MSPPVPRRVLVVEDEMMIAMMVEDMLAEMGHAVIGVASNLRSALALAAAEQFDVAILDINLAGERSFPVAHLLKARGVPFLFATGYGELGLEDPFRDVVTLKKPFDIEDLAGAVERAAMG
jgi:DNA-binding response OmpR family regulator